MKKKTVTAESETGKQLSTVNNRPGPLVCHTAVFRTSYVSREPLPVYRPGKVVKKRLRAFDRANEIDRSVRHANNARTLSDIGFSTVREMAF